MWVFTPPRAEGGTAGTTAERPLPRETQAAPHRRRSSAWARVSQFPALDASWPSPASNFCRTRFGKAGKNRSVNHKVKIYCDTKDVRQNCKRRTSKTRQRFRCMSGVTNNGVPPANSRFQYSAK